MPPAPGRSWDDRAQGTLRGPHRLPRGRIEQACFQRHHDVAGMEGGRLSLPAPYLDIESAAFEFATSSHISRLLGAVGRLLAYGCDDHLRGNDRDASPCELLAYFCRQGIGDGDAPRTVCVRVQKRRAFNQERVTCTIVGRQHGDRLDRCWQRWNSGRPGTTEGEERQQQPPETSRYHRRPPVESVISLRRRSMASRR